MYEFYIIDSHEIYNASLSVSIIYSGIEKKTGNKIAVKELKKEKMKDEYIHEMAKNEFAIQYSLCKDCNNIVQVKDYFEDDKAYYLVMEYSEEPDFFEDLLENRYCPVSDEKTLKAFAFDILTGLNWCHKNNVIHCDIKPQNFLLFKSSERGRSKVEEEINGDDNIDDDENEEILLYEDFDLKLADFGFAHIVPEGEEKAFMKFPCGTFAYISPEIAKVIFIICLIIF
jgi:serine/threonine protein kinase